MIEVEIWYYINSESRIIRFSRAAFFSAVPFIGSSIEIPHDSLEISRVIFKDGGGVVLVVIESDNEVMWKDSEVKDSIEEMSENGWTVLSNVERKGYIQKGS